MANTVNLNQDYPTISASLKLYEQARAIMPPVTQTMAKGPGQYSLGAAPIYLKRGKGARVWDVDGNEYIDFMNSLAAITLGYCDPYVDAAVKSQLENGTIFYHTGSSASAYWTFPNVFSKFGNAI
jgi:glutamate-1-semialdehyde aminotransferase